MKKTVEQSLKKFYGWHVLVNKLSQNADRGHLFHPTHLLGVCGIDISNKQHRISPNFIIQRLTPHLQKPHPSARLIKSEARAASYISFMRLTQAKSITRLVLQLMSSTNYTSITYLYVKIDKITCSTMILAYLAKVSSHGIFTKYFCYSLSLLIIPATILIVTALYRSLLCCIGSM